MKKLTLYPVSSIDQLAQPEAPVQLTLDSPALEFFTDFSHSQPLVIHDSASAVEAREMMIKTHVRLKLVVIAGGDFAGVISADDLSEQNILQRAIAMRANRGDLRVRDLMTPKGELLALSIDEVSRVSIGDVVAMLKDNYQQHCLVLDPASHKIRGIFSASDISRKLKLRIDIRDQSNFYKVFAAIG